MEQKNVAMLVTAFIALIIGISLIGTIAFEEQKLVKYTFASETVDLATGSIDLTHATNISYNNTVTNAPTGWKVADCPPSSFKLYNASGIDADNLATVDTDYFFEASTGKWHLLDTDFFNNSVIGSNSSSQTYDYCPDNYVTQAWTRSVLNIVVGFFAIAILAVGIALMYGVLKNEGLLNI